ncbi:MAG: elongation factor P [Magnetovibrio sp.]|nr:elongation factor P [Magnetovibrio sp.]
MKINGNTIRPGMVIEHQDRLWRAVKTQHTQPGKGGAYLQVELKDLQSGTKLNQRFRASESVERAILEQNDYTYLYSDGEMFTFMHVETYEQIELSAEAIGEDQVLFLQENMKIVVESHDDTPLGVQLPNTVILEVTEADAVIKGQTASSSYKPALLENGLKTQVPPFIAAGTRIVVNTEDGSYVERAKD